MDPKARPSAFLLLVGGLLFLSTSVFAQLLPGQFAPAFSAKDIDGQFHSVDQYKGKQVLISFYRNITSPVSRKRFEDLEREQAFLRQRDVIAIAVFPSAQEYLLRYRDTSGFYQLIVSDTSEILYRLFGVSEISGFRPALLRKKSKVAVPASLKDSKEPKLSSRAAADILIGVEGNIKYTHYGKSESDHLPMPRLRNWIDNL